MPELDLKPTFRSYYFTLEGTGVPEIDAILQIVAAAGKGYHNTEGWDDDSCGPSFITRINEAAAKAAAAWNTRPSGGEAVAVLIEKAKKIGHKSFRSMDAFDDFVRTIEDAEASLYASAPSPGVVEALRLAGDWIANGDANNASEADAVLSVINSALSAKAQAGGEDDPGQQYFPMADESPQAGETVAGDDETAAKHAHAIVEAFKDVRSGVSEHEALSFLRTLIGKALLASAPASSQPRRWRHKRRGSTYTEIGRGKVQSDRWIEPTVNNPLVSARSVDMREVVIYRADEDGSLWVRPVEEFEDGRFEALPPARGG